MGKNIRNSIELKLILKLPFLNKPIIPKCNFHVNKKEGQSPLSSKIYYCYLFFAVFTTSATVVAAVARFCNSDGTIIFVA